MAAVPPPQQSGAIPPTSKGTPTSGSGPSPCVVLIPNPVKGIPLIGDLISSAGVCLFTKTEARALIGGLALASGGVTTLIGVSILIVSAFGHTKAGQSAAKLGGGLAEGVGAGLAFVPGAEAAGAAVAAGGSAIKHRQGAAGKSAQSTKTRRAGAKQAQVKQVTAQKAAVGNAQGQAIEQNKRFDRAQQRNDDALHKKVAARKNPGRGGATLSSPARETGRQRSQRMANPAGTGRHRKPPAREEVGF